MKKKEKIIDACSDIFNLFVNQESTGKDGIKDLLNFLSWITEEKYDPLTDLMGNLKLGEKSGADILCDDIWMPLAHTAFGIGFTLGQLIEPTEPQIKEKLEILKKVIKDEQLLPYLPRERKERRMP
jgi:hypothetical protein